jgi:hypothetical protein
MEESPSTVFKFTAEGIDLEFSGSEEFVEKQVQLFRAFLESAVGQAGAAAGTLSITGGAGEAAEKEPESLPVFYSARPTREGRGAIQDRILLFIYYMQHVQQKQAVSKEDIAWCFQQVELPVPKNLLNALGNMKRKLGFLQGGGRRGLYQLSPKGEQYVTERFAPA